MEEAFAQEMLEALKRDSPTVFFITSQSLKRRMAELEGETYYRLTEALDSLFFDEAHHLGALQTRESLQGLLYESDGFLFGSTATPVHPEVNLTEMFDESHFSYLKPSELSDSVSKKTLLQLSRSIERGDITGFDDVYVIGEPLFKGKESLFVKEKTSGYRVLNPSHYSRLVEVINPILESNNRGLLVVASIREANRLSRYLNDFFGGKMEFFSYHSEMTPRARSKVLRRLEEAGEVPRYIVSVRALDEGMDIPPLSAYIDLNSNVSVKQMLHRIGRVLRVREGKLRSDIAFLTDYKDRRMSEDLLELLDAMEVVKGFDNARKRSLELDLEVPVFTREELSASRDLLERAARNYWRGEDFVDYEAFAIRIKQALERGELDVNKMSDSYKEWQRGHSDMPSAPYLFYKGEFPGWRELLKKFGMARKADIEAFEEKIKQALERGELDPNRMHNGYSEWQKGHPDMPATPNKFYNKEEFPGWPQLLKRIGMPLKVDIETFAVRIKQALERGELDTNRMLDSYSEWQKGHPDMPANPTQFYKREFPGWREFFKKIGVVRKVDIETFKARIKQALKRGELDPNRMYDSYREWQKGHPDMPSTPGVFYKGKFSGWGKLLKRIGISRKVDFKTFEERIKQALKRGELDTNRMFSSYREWQKGHPDMPATPDAFYKGDFPGWREFLKKIGIASKVDLVDFETFTARTKQALERGELDPNRMFDSYREWEKGHPDMPSSPNTFYKEEFPGWRKLLKKIGIARKVDFETFTVRIKQALERGELDPNRMSDGYNEWQKSHPDMPANPIQFYKDEFPGWPQLLKKIGIASKVDLVDFETFTVRIKQALERGELNPNWITYSYRDWSKGHSDIPANPNVFYKGEFPGWREFLKKFGMARKANIEAFEERIEQALERGELDPNRMLDSYKKWQKSHPDMPSAPYLFYKGEFPGWREFLKKIGIASKMDLVDFETFTARIKQALEREELDPNRMSDSYREWQKGHPDMSSAPYLFYKGEFPGWPELLKRIGMPLKVDIETFTARIKQALERGELDPNRMSDSYREWQKGHSDMPLKPNIFYKGEFPGWRKLFKKIGIASKVDFETFTARIKQALERGELDMNRMSDSYREWQKGHPDMPRNPNTFYKEESPGWRKLLKKIGIARKVDFETFTVRIKQALERGELDPNRMSDGYNEWQKSHPDMPANPIQFYKDEFPGWIQFKLRILNLQVLIPHDGMHWLASRVA